MRCDWFGRVSVNDLSQHRGVYGIGRLVRVVSSQILDLLEIVFVLACLQHAFRPLGKKVVGAGLMDSILKTFTMCSLFTGYQHCPGEKQYNYKGEAK